MKGTQAGLAASYRECRRLHRACGTTYFWATWMLPAEVRPHVHALYGFCRRADDIVDGSDDVEAKAAALAAFGGRLFADLERGQSHDPVLAAVVNTVRVLGIDPSCFGRFLRSMAMDLTVTTYEDFDSLAEYMDGSAAVIGEMMLPVLRPSSTAALGPARDLGIAFQLTNFLRDVGEDLDRGRVYLPQCDLVRFGASAALEGRRVTPAWVELMRFEIARTRELYRSAEAGLALLPAVSARCIGTARALYEGILDLIEARGYDVFSGRVRVPTMVKLTAAGRARARSRRDARVPKLTG